MKAIKQPEDIFITFRHLTSTDWTMNFSHFHDHFELNLSISGGNRFFINDVVYLAKPGDLFFFNDKDLHRNLVPHNFKYERYLIMFDPKVMNIFSNEETDLLEIFHKNNNSNNYLSLSQEKLFELTNLLNNIIYHAKSDYYNNKLYLKIRLAEVLMFINKLYHNDNIIQNDKVHKSFQKTKEVIDFINQNLSDNLTLDIISSKFFIHKTYLCDKFKKDTGFTINQYITNRRILEAKALLNDGKTVTEVAREVGYNNDSHFIRTFKKLVGLTPKQYALKK